MLVTNTQVDELLDVLSDLSGLDAELAEGCGLLIRSERYDEAVSRAFVVLEERLREVLKVRGGAGRRLVQRLFSSKDAQYTERLCLPRNEVEGLGNLFDGAFAAFRNRAAHTKVGYTSDEARGIVHLVNLLLLIVEQMKKAPPPRVMPEVAQSLGPAATERLHQFLGRLQALGVGMGQGKASVPYRATLVYQSEGWEEPRAHPVAIFYLAAARGGRPVLAFNTSYLGKVPGLDRSQLERDLLDAGCLRVGAGLRPIQLYLDEHNDQAVFGRIYEIVRGLMEKHRA
jgi:uncharacterized protein (TIGR02391 family)